MSLFYLKHFGFPGKQIDLRKYLLTASFLQMSNFCFETQFPLINCLFLEQIICKKHKKKSPVGHLAHWGFFLTPHSKALLRASFCANKKFQAYYGKTAVFRFDVESREKNIVPIQIKQRFLRCFGRSGCNWICLVFVSMRCFVTLAFHAFGDL